MDILFKEEKFRKQSNKDSELLRAHGSRRGKLIRVRLDALRAATCLEDLRHIPGRLHELKGDRKGQLSFDLDHPYRLIFVPNHAAAARTADKGLNWERVTAVKILGIVDTHE